MYSIAIVGAGPVGSLLAIYLKKAGHRVTVFERRKDERQVSHYSGRSINIALSHRGIRALQEIDLFDTLKSSFIPMFGRMVHNKESHPNFQPYGMAGESINSISRNTLNKVILDAAEKAGAHILFQHHVTHVDIDNTRLTILSGKDKTTQEFDYIFGADGASSVVRDSMHSSNQFTCTQTYMDYGYQEFNIPSGKGGNFVFEKTALHIWPREHFMFIALPNLNGTFTGTLFLTLEGDPSFKTLSSPHLLSAFFRDQFPDLYEYIPQLTNHTKNNPTSSLTLVNCFPWVHNKTALIGDAAHALFPFFGQGLNCSFEGCKRLNHLLINNKEWDSALRMYEEERKPNTDAISNLSMANFIEMRNLVSNPKFLLQKRIENHLHKNFPKKWIPLYTMVTFRDDLPYAQVQQISQRQEKIIEKIMNLPHIETDWEKLDYTPFIDPVKNFA